MERSERLTRVIAISVATALVGAIFSLCVGLVLAANQYRTNIRAEEAARITRQINVLVLLRDELARVQSGIERGTFQVKAENSVVQSEGYAWPTQIWCASNRSEELLSIEPSLIQLLANIHSEIAHAEQVRSNTARTGAAELSRYMENMFRAMGAPEADLAKIRKTDPQFEANKNAYNDIQTRIQQQLPPILAALDIKINELRSRLPK